MLVEMLFVIFVEKYVRYHMAILLMIMNMIFVYRVITFY